MFENGVAFVKEGEPLMWNPFKFRCVSHAQLSQQIKQLGDQMTVDFTKFNADMAALSAAVAANTTLLQELTAEIKAISGSTTDAATQAQLDALAVQMEGLTGTIVSDDAANAATPVTPPPPPATPTA
jgi:phage host-nuclease inhibitor protein Gam